MFANGVNILLGVVYMRAIYYCHHQKIRVYIVVKCLETIIMIKVSINLLLHCYTTVFLLQELNVWNY